MWGPSFPHPTPSLMTTPLAKELKMSSSSLRTGRPASCCWSKAERMLCPSGQLDALAALARRCQAFACVRALVVSSSGNVSAHSNLQVRWTFGQKGAYRTRCRLIKRVITV